MTRRVPAPDHHDQPDAETAPLDFGELPDVTPGRIPVTLPTSRAYRIPRDVRLREEKWAHEKAVREKRRGDVRPRTLVRHSPLPHSDFTARGLWSVVTRSAHPSSWYLLPWDLEAETWAAEVGTRGVDADVLMLAPVR